MHKQPGNVLMCMYELIHSREEQGTTTAAAAAGNSIRFSRVKMNEKKEDLIYRGTIRKYTRPPPPSLCTLYSLSIGDTFTSLLARALNVSFLWEKSS
jgi:hypothetical protein